MNGYVLIADSDSARASFYAEIVKAKGLTSHVVKEGVSAAALLFERGAPTLVIVDLALPRAGGLDLIERLRRSTLTTRTPVIAVSSSPALRQSAAMLREKLGIGAILSKAVTRESLRRVVHMLLGGTVTHALDHDAQAEGPAPEHPESGVQSRIKVIRDARDEGARLPRARKLGQPFG